METWKPIDNFKGYEVSDKFRVRRQKEGWSHYKIIEPSIIKSSENLDTYRYLMTLRKDNKSYQHNLIQLVAQAFVPNPMNKSNAIIDCLTNLGVGEFRVEYILWVDKREVAATAARLHGVNHVTGKLLTSDYIGVYAERKRKVSQIYYEDEFTGFFIARARVNGKYKYIGRYPNQEDAKEARDNFLKQ